MELTDFAQKYIGNLRERLGDVLDGSLEKIIIEIDKIRDLNKNIFIIGNGGSAATAAHLATDLSKTSHIEGARRIRAMSLVDNISWMTAIANDISYDQIFVDQLKVMLMPGDMLIAISGSGNSPNVIKAVEFAKEKGVVTVGFLGFDGGNLKSLVDICIHIHSDQYGIVEDAHVSIGHILAFFIKERDRKRLIG